MEEREVRLKKLEELKRMGINPYPYRFEKTHDAKEIKKEYDKYEGKKVKTAGRVIAKRVFGKLIFAKIQDEEDSIQIVIQKGTKYKDLELVKFFKNMVDIGDWIGVEGEVFKTQKGEISIKVENFWLLSKSLSPLPEKWHGLKDKELLYRARYLDFITNFSTRKLFKIRNKIIKFIRDYFNKEGFIEFETPVLQPIYGGASARPFETYSNALDTKLYLRIADELYLKRLIVGGFEKVFEIGKNFRNEGIDKTHYPEFTFLEAYAAWWDYNDMMKFTERLLNELVKRIFGKEKITYENYEIDFSTPFKKVKFIEELNKIIGEDILSMPEEKLIEIAQKEGIKAKHKAKIIDKLFDIKIGKNLINPTFVIDHPVELTPLAKRHRENSKLVERFELFVAGIEIANAFSELNDPIEQRKRFEEEVK